MSQLISWQMIQNLTGIKVYINQTRPMDNVLLLFRMLPYIVSETFLFWLCAVTVQVK